MIEQVTFTQVGQSHGYNRTTAHYRVEVSMFSTNVTSPLMVERIENMIRAMYPNIAGIGSSHLTSLSNLGIVRVDEVPSTRHDGKPWEYSVGAWEFDYETSGCD